MKAFAGLSLVGLLAIAIYWVAALPGKPEAEGVQIPIAMGNVDEGMIEMHAAIGVALANMSRLKESPASKLLDWDKWIERHCILKSKAGQTIPLQRANNSSLLKVHEIQPMIGTQEFFLTAKLRLDTDYTFDYIIESPDAKVYRRHLTAPQHAEKARLLRFDPQ